MGRRFLLVDDSRVMRRLVQKTLAQAGFADAEYLEADDGQQALDELEKVDYSVDAVFCDCNMPNLDGFGFLGELSSRGKLESCPVIIVTGEANEELEREALAAGAKSCLGKPFTADKVAGILGDVL